MEHRKVIARGTGTESAAFVVPEVKESACPGSAAPSSTSGAKPVVVPTEPSPIPLRHAAIQQLDCMALTAETLPFSHQPAQPLQLQPDISDSSPGGADRARPPCPSASSLAESSFGKNDTDAVRLLSEYGQFSPDFKKYRRIFRQEALETYGEHILPHLRPKSDDDEGESPGNSPRRRSTPEYYATCEKFPGTPKPLEAAVCPISALSPVSLNEGQTSASGHSHLVFPCTSTPTRSEESPRVRQGKQAADDNAAFGSGDGGCGDLEHVTRRRFLSPKRDPATGCDNATPYTPPMSIEFPQHVRATAAALQPGSNHDRGSPEDSDLSSPELRPNSPSDAGFDGPSVSADAHTPRPPFRPAKRVFRVMRAPRLRTISEESETSLELSPVVQPPLVVEDDNILVDECELSQADWSSDYPDSMVDRSPDDQRPWHSDSRPLLSESLTSFILHELSLEDLPATPPPTVNLMAANEPPGSTASKLSEKVLTDQTPSPSIQTTD